MDHHLLQHPNGPGPMKSSSSLCGLPTYHNSQVSVIYREPFIINGYRKADPSCFECVQYAFVRHNDVWNFWSHFLPLCAWLAWLYGLSFHYDLSQPYLYPLLCFWLGGCSYALFSSIAHLFGCKSATARSIAYMLDYLGISMYVAGGGIYAFYHQQPLSSPLYDYQFPFLCLHMLLSVNATLVSSLTRFYFYEQRFVIRALAYAPPYISSFAPVVLRLLSCVSTGHDCIHATLHLHLICIVLPWVILFFFVSKIPERFAAGTFDIFFQSHTLFHLSSAVLTSIQMYTFPIDAEIRKADWHDKLHPSFETVFVPFVTMIVVGLAQVGAFTFLISKGILIPHKADAVPGGIKQD